MATKLVIVESPAKAKTIAKFLGRGYKVEASQGHVRDLPKSQIGVSPENDFEPKYITIRGRGDILNRIRKEARSAAKVYLATDPDREGEAISWHLANVLGIDEHSPCRIEFNEVTMKAVKAAVKNPRGIDIDRVNAQQARRVLDRLVGYKISPILWAKVKKGLSAGRVQSVAAKMICDRENEIDTFLPEEYYNIAGRFMVNGAELTARFYGENGEKMDVHTREECDALLARAREGAYSVRAIKKSERRKMPAAPFTTSNLQQEASRKLNFNTGKTMQIAQQLYEGVELAGEGLQGLVTYIRTDSTRISDEALASVREMIQSTYGEPFLPAEPNIYKSRKTAQDAHEAIRPTDIARRPEAIKASLTRDQFRLYRLIYDRFVSSQMTPAVFDTLSADIAGENGLTFHLAGQKMKFAGFTVVYEEVLDDAVEEKDISLPDLEEGMSASLLDVTGEQRFTQPPPRYTEASLVRALEEKGIGRPSTYAPTISTIITRGYVARENKRLIPTELGKIVNDLMCKNFPDIVNIQFTADMEEKLDDVEKGQVDWHVIVRDFYGPFEKDLEKAEASIEKVSIEDQVSDIPCEKCGAMMVYKMSRYGKFLACPNFPACRHTLALPKSIGVACPQCGAQLLERISRKGRKFYGCERYPECDFVSWDRPVNDKCPVCGSRMVYKRGPRNTHYHVCVNESCRHRVEVEAENDE
ncbi:MAG TPA: type I DNA topoisomerase [Candidatus Pullichristensenella excrementipullorum]|nr:type I DNA topoisomerase [Candidatus Pullichristensenella excrementipullorum]